MKPFLLEPFTNEIDQVINPGDAIVIVTTCSHSACISKGRYLGLRRQKGWRDRDVTKVVIEYDRVRTESVHNVTGKPWKYNWDEVPGLEDVPQPEYPRLTGSRWGTPSPQDQAARDEYNAKYTAYNEAHARDFAKVQQYQKDNYHGVHTPYIVRKTLELNRIFKIDTTLAAIENI